MKKVTFLFAFVMAMSLSVVAQKTSWQIDPAHSKIGFTVTHLVISEVEGSFKKVDAKMVSTKPDFTDSQIEFSADVNSIDTENEDRDKHLKSADFFDAANHDKIKFVSKTFKKVSGNEYKLTGDLTIKGVTKPVTLDVVYGGTAKDPYGNTKAGFKVNGKISRKEYGLTWNTLTEAGGAVVGDEVELVGKIQLQQIKLASN
ncbi:YceI family protein [Rhodocytophaga aerolata]|uniref:YceI family protein n=1 Tax=Rhodocytophaga aerolata TaxID=455078 RepID=A0ABT8QY80_9BACT|nr:YceI family protein [Rhodocytophaga aerolata]MDO1444800.1 YceI family protein [Rhodocytophaga aerolata]